MRHLNTLYVLVFILFSGLLLLVVGCREEPAAEDTNLHDDKLKVVVTLSFFEDMVRQVGKDYVEIKALIPVGVEPEDYEPVAQDIRAINDAALFIYNGHYIERWLPQVIPDLEEKQNAFALAEHPSIKTIPLPRGPFAGDPDPHAWTDVNYALIYVEQIVSILAETDPDNKKFYQNQGKKYKKELRDLDRWIQEQVKKIPKEKRILITSELCFQYYSQAYGFKHDAIWSINAPEEGSPDQIIRLVDQVKELEPPSVFVENQVDHRPMEQVSRETGVAIGGVLYSDSLSHPGEGGETYIKMMKSNTRQIVTALKGKDEL